MIKTKTLSLSRLSGTGQITQIGLTLAVLVSMLIFPMFSYASTYEYINTSGTVSSLNANSPAEALSNAFNLGLYSGVILVQGSGGMFPVQYIPGQSIRYGYVNSSGVITIVTANTSSGAFADSVNISEHSGVMLINSQADEDLIGNTTSM